MLKRFVLLLALLMTAVRADALEYNDVYYNPDESGWGVFVVQSDVAQFIALFIYGTDNKPTWYTAQLTQDATGAFTGQLYATTGTYFGLPWNKSQLTVAAAGTASFKPTDPYRATLTYALTNGPSVTKSVQRQGLTGHKLAGFYDGAMAGSQSNCANPGQNDPQLLMTFNLSAVQNGESGAALNFTFKGEDAGLACRADGPLTHFGRLYKMTNAQFTCTGPGAPPNTTVTIDALHPTDQGIEGRLSGSINGCTVSAGFSAVRSF